MHTIEIKDFIKDKVFRTRENLKKIDFIIENSDITPTTLVKTATIAIGNEYHNFGHQLGVAEYAIKIATAEKRTREEINTLAFAGLIHDAGHKGLVTAFDEIRSLEITEIIMEEFDLSVINSSKEISLGKLRDLVIATIFSNRGKINDPLAKIMQDADLAHLGQGINYWLWASMGLIEEFARQRKSQLSPIDFIKIEQEKFVNFLAKISGTNSVFLSTGANQIFRDPLEDVQQIKKLPDEIIDYAYSVRRDDITLEEFEDFISEIILQKKLK